MIELTAPNDSKTLVDGTRVHRIRASLPSEGLQVRTRIDAQQAVGPLPLSLMTRKARCGDWHMPQTRSSLACVRAIGVEYPRQHI